MKKMLLSFVLMLTAMGAWADEITFSPLQYETLPDLETPRRGHACFATADGDIVVVGGHTTGFDLTATAERLHDGQWESLSVNYAHDGAANITLSDGRVLICGGMGSGYGVGQSTACEIYDPATNSFTATGSLTTARAFCTGVPTGEGDNVLLSGNWYNSDSSFELWDGSTWTAFGEKSPALSNPFMVNAGDGIVYVFGCRTNYGSLVDVAAWKVDTKSQTVEAVAETGLEEYELIHGDYFTVHTVDGSFYLLGVKDNEFHLLNFSTATATVTDMCTLPRTMPGENNSIEYVSGILVNASRQEAYIVGGYLSNAGNKTLVVVNYNLETGKTTAYYGGDFPGYIHWGAWALQPTTERIIFTGGAVSDNFDEVATSIIVTPYSKGDDAGIATPEASSSAIVPWYTLDGRRISTPIRGHIYVNNGKKVIVK